MNAAADELVVGSGPNGLAAAITLARAGHAVTVLEAADTWGGGLRSAELTLPGFIHDVCATSFPLGVASPFFHTVPLARYGATWVHPDVPLAHPLDDGSAVLLERSVEATAAGLGPDAAVYRRLMGKQIARVDRLIADILRPLRLPRHPVTLARFGLLGMQSASYFARSVFMGERARALFAGLAAHSFLRLDQPSSAAAGLVLASLGHAVGWPFVQGGSQRLSDALVGYLSDLGGRVETGQPVRSLGHDAPAPTTLLDLTPRQVLDVAGPRLSGSYQRALSRFRYGPGVFKIDWALDGPIPWRAAACGRAGVVHLGGTLEEIAASEAAANSGRVADRPFVILAQPTLFDPTRAPAGRHIAWAYCHVPHSAGVDMTDRIEAQVERFAPGFRDRILARHVLSPAEMEALNTNYVGGDINGGIQDLRQLFARPVARWDPYRTSDPMLFLCSSSTPPGGGVHGMCGYWAAKSVLASNRRQWK